MLLSAVTLSLMAAPGLAKMDSFTVLQNVGGTSYYNAVGINNAGYVVQLIGSERRLRGGPVVDPRRHDCRPLAST